MYLIKDILISDDVLKKKFVCDLQKCQGACCWEGDFGAPLSDEETQTIKNIYPKIKNLLSTSSLDKLSKSGFIENHPDNNSAVTPIMPDGACVYLVKDSDNIAKCSFEKAYEDGMTDFRKPISCHLYPLRILQNKPSGFEAINYDMWDICSAACNKGEKLSVPVFRFVKDAIIRKYGLDFYNEMEQIYADSCNSNDQKSSI